MMRDLFPLQILVNSRFRLFPAAPAVTCRPLQEIQKIPLQKMIKLFVLDIDGCITHPYEPPHWESISQIRELNRKSRTTREIPPLTLCTGRPLPYAEAVAQWLDIQLPFVFESAALYKPESNQIRTALNRNGQFMGNGDALRPIREFKEWLVDDLLPGFPDVMLEFSKMMDAGVVSSNRDQIDRIYDLIIRQVRDNYPELEVFRTDVSVNTLLAGNNKGKGFDLLSRDLEIPVSEMAYIGDSEGDLLPLRRVAMPFAPINADEEVKEVAEVDVIPLETSEAVLEAYKKIIQKNLES